MIDKILELIKGKVSKQEIYIALIAITIAWSLTYFNVVQVPCLLLFLYIFLSVCTLLLLYRVCRKILYRIEAKIKENKRTQRINKDIGMAFIGMGIEYKMDALKIIKYAKPASNDIYTYIVTPECQEHLMFCYEGFNPFQFQKYHYIRSFITWHRQNDYAIAKFERHFYTLIKEHAKEIEEEFANKFPYE